LIHAVLSVRLDGGVLLRSGDMESILMYYRDIPKLIEDEKAEQDMIVQKYYNGLRSPGLDGMPHGGGKPGNPTEKMGIKAAQDNAARMLARCERRISVLESDKQILDWCLNGLSGEYKKLIFERVIFEYTWSTISGNFDKAISTVRTWYGDAVQRVENVLENELKMLDVLTFRASCARDKGRNTSESV